MDELGEEIEDIVSPGNQMKESRMNLETESTNIRPMDWSVKSFGVTYQLNGESVESGVLTEESITEDSANFVTMDKDVKAAAVLDQQIEKSIESGVLSEGASAVAS